jgi:spore coat protein CotH
MRRQAVALVRAACLAGALSAGIATAQTIEDFFNESKFQDIYLTIHPKDWARLRETYLDDTYYPANFLWNGIELPDIGIRSRGRGSRSPVKPNLRLDFNRFEEGQNLFGLKSVVLKANNQDASLMHERIAMKLFDKMGLPASKEAPVRLWVNEDFFGVYSMVESIDKDFMFRNFKDKEGYLYQFDPMAEGFYFNDLGPEVEKYIPFPFQPETHGKEPQGDILVQMIRELNQAADADFMAAVSRYLDPKLFLRHLAVEMYLAEFDGLLGDVFGMNNFYLHRMEKSTMFQFIPWDKDGTFDHYSRSVMSGVEKNILVRRLLADPEMRTFYFATLWEIAGMADGPEGWLMKEIDRMYAQVAEWARQEPNKRCPGGEGQISCGAEEFEKEVRRIREFANLRSYAVKYELWLLGYQPPAT